MLDFDKRTILVVHIFVVFCSFNCNLKTLGETKP